MYSAQIVTHSTAALFDTENARDGAAEIQTDEVAIGSWQRARRKLEDYSIQEYRIVGVFREHP